MRKRLLPEAAYYTNKNKLHSIWRKFVRFMACIVVFCTTYALILPAITMEKTRCGIEEHTHSESCYAKQTQRQITMPACTVESLGVHTHTEACYDADGGLVPAGDPLIPGRCGPLPQAVPVPAINEKKVDGMSTFFFFAGCGLIHRYARWQTG